MTVKIVVMAIVTGMSIPEAKIYEEMMQIKTRVMIIKIKKILNKVAEMNASSIQKITNERRSYIEKFG